MNHRQHSSFVLKFRLKTTYLWQSLGNSVKQLSDSFSCLEKFKH